MEERGRRVGGEAGRRGGGETAGGEAVEKQRRESLLSYRLSLLWWEVLILAGETAKRKV